MPETVTDGKTPSHYARTAEGLIPSPLPIIY